ncbi:chitin synthase regulator Skt5p [[Candida] anglica]|uniref:Chitin synthase regulator Skt5p n=1 Tax=[Candida] anglica TaxID=148631 RepID=A0ABP0EFC5_9ASCO
MSSHPYRQKVANESPDHSEYGDPPYPQDAFAQASKSFNSQPAQTFNSQPTNNYQEYKYPPKMETPYPVSPTELEVKPATSASAPVAPTPTTAATIRPTSPILATKYQYNHQTHTSLESSSSGSNVESPKDGEFITQSPPPVFSKNNNFNQSGKTSQVTSPTFNTTSATSSVTNFTLGGGQSRPSQESANNYDNLKLPHNGGGYGSKSDSNVDHVYSNNVKYGHSRQVSSTSSLFVDKSDAVSMVDYGHNVIQQYLGSNSHRSVPRIKTLELYRQNAKKSNDPTVLYQYAQYMLQTALMMDGQGSNGSTPPTNSPMKSSKTGHKKNKSHNSLNDMDQMMEIGGKQVVGEKELRKELIREALHYLRKLSDKGYVDAQYLLADAHSSGALGKVENKYSFVLFQSAAKHGHVESAYRTSYCFEEGLGTGRDARKAIEYLKIAASKNHPSAMYKLGIYSFYGRMGMPHDVNTQKMGIKWLTRASNVATELTAAAPFELGKIYFQGFKDIIIKDEKYSLELYSQAAALGHVESARILGHYYEVGEIVPQDSNLSIHYYTQAALGGDAEAMLAMCAWYLVGSEPFLPKDELEAFEWAKRSAQSNYVKAQYALGNFYEKGVGCERNSTESQNWYKRAAQGGDEKSLARVTDKEWVAKHQKGNKNRSRRNNGGAKGENIAAQEKDCVIV